MSEEIPAARRARLNALLLDWYARSHRDLPWRRTRDPYAVWLSEVMAQQTQVATVIPYWHRYLERFPTVGDLARASLDEVLALWSGLGYYARARNLHRAAQALVERHAGEFPRDLEALESLPGFGPYTAGAVGSIALGLDAPVVDGNVARVFCRVEGWSLGAQEARAKSWKVAGELVPKGRAGDWNQALMELGATVCIPASPKCAGCPLASECRAVETGAPGTYPLAKQRKPKKRLQLVAVSVEDDEGRVLLVRGAADGLFGGLWNLPHLEIGDGAAAAAAESLAHSLCGGKVKPELRGVVSHTLTHRELEVSVYALRARPELSEGSLFVKPEEITALGISTLAVKMLRTAGVVLPGGHGRRSSAKVGQAELFSKKTA